MTWLNTTKARPLLLHESLFLLDFFAKCSNFVQSIFCKKNCWKFFIIFFGLWILFMSLSIFCWAWSDVERYLGSSVKSRERMSMFFLRKTYCQRDFRAQIKAMRIIVTFTLFGQNTRLSFNNGFKNSMQ